MNVGDRLTINGVEVIVLTASNEGRTLEVIEEQSDGATGEIRLMSVGRAALPLTTYERLGGG